MESNLFRGQKVKGQVTSNENIAAVGYYIHRRNFTGTDPTFCSGGRTTHFISTPQAWSPTFQTKVTQLITFM